MYNASQVSQVGELENRVAEYLGKAGYQVTPAARVPGRSGIEHVFDLLARRDDGFGKYVVAINFSTGASKEAQLHTVFDMANESHDTGIRHRVIVFFSQLEPETTEFAQKQKIRVIEIEQLEKVLSTKPRLAGDARNLSLKTKAELLQALSDIGYRVERNVRVQGRSGTDHMFDILAYGDHSLISHSLAVETIEHDGEAVVEQVSAFDTRAADAGIDHKALFVLGKLADAARELANKQDIRIIEAFEKPAAQAAETAPSPVDVKPVTPKTAGKGQIPLRQMPQPEALQLIPEVMARRYSAIPLSIVGNTLQVAMANPTDIFALEAFAAQTKKRIKPVAASAEEVRDAIDFNYKAYGEIEDALARIAPSLDAADDRLAIMASDAPLTQALNLIIDEAAKARSSDVHIEPEENRLRIRYRIDGTLHDTMSLPINIHKPLISRIKILAEMNITDHYRPQDGQFSSESRGRKLDIRVATAPTIHGEMAVMRLLDKSLATRGLSEIGLLPESLDKYEKMLKYPYGMILVSGPTGSGKTTTLYASIGSIDVMSKNIITVEDPAEYRFKDINQIQVNNQAGITFASGLRSILRLDPDVILVGEIRDGETASIAVQAALTGHLMLSSIHANDSVGALFRLIDLHVEPFLISSSVIGIVAQRMVRRICADCRRLIEAPVSEQIAYEKVLGEKRNQFYYGVGCQSCSFTGYRGRTGLFEILTLSDPIRTMLTDGASKVAIRNQALKEGTIPMAKDGMLKVKDGLTTPSEVLRATYTQD